MEWIARYSSTDEFDKQGRWARLCYLNNSADDNILLAWIDKTEHDNKVSFTANTFFPVNHNNNPLGINKFSDYESAKAWIEDEWHKFKQKSSITTNKQKSFSEWPGTVELIFIIIAILLCAGEPDLLDALIKLINNYAETFKS